MNKAPLPHAEAAAIARGIANDLQLEAIRIAEFHQVTGSAKKTIREARLLCQGSEQRDASDSQARNYAADAAQHLRKWASELEGMQRDAVRDAAEMMRVSVTYLEIEAWHRSRLNYDK